LNQYAYIILHLHIFNSVFISRNIAVSTAGMLATSDSYSQSHKKMFTWQPC